MILFHVYFLTKDVDIGVRGGGGGRGAAALPV